MPPEMLRLCALALQAATVSAGLGDLLGGIIDTLNGGVSDGGAGAGAGPGAVAIASASAAPLTEPKCADNLAAGASDLCQPRFVWGLRNGGPQPASSNAGASPAEGGKGVSLTWKACYAEGSLYDAHDCEQAIARLLLDALGVHLESELASEAWGPRSGEVGKPQWQVYAANGERVQSWGGVLAAPSISTAAPALAAGDDTGASVAAVADDPDGVPKVIVPLYIAPEGRLFVWPIQRVGYVTPVPGVQHNREPGAPTVTVETLCVSPRIFRIRNFLSDTEANGLVDETLKITDPMYSLQRSGTGHVPRSKTKQKTVASTRSSENAFVSHSALAKTVKQRAFELLRVPRFSMQQSDGIQVLRYQLGQAYIGHTDYFPVKKNSVDWHWDPATNGSNRFATVFLYLSDVSHGGQTVFPNAKAPPGWEPSNNPWVPAAVGDGSDEAAPPPYETGSWEEKMTALCESSFAVSPRKGDAIVFYSQRPNGGVDPQSLHGGCPVLNGTKWAANLWVWNADRFKTGATANTNGQGYNGPNTLPPPGQIHLPPGAAKRKPDGDIVFDDDDKVSVTFKNALPFEVSLRWVCPRHTACSLTIFHSLPARLLCVCVSVVALA